MSQRNFYKTLAEAREAAHQYKFTSAIDYRLRRCECDVKLHSNPQIYYRSEWLGWHDFLNTEPASNKLYQTYQQAKAAAQQANFKNARSYKQFCKEIDPRLPKVPKLFYQAQWQSWEDYLGITNSRYYSNYHEARQRVQALGITSTQAYYTTRKQLDEKLPANPIKQYGVAWQGWADFFGKPPQQERLYSHYTDAKQAAARFHFKSASDYQKRAKLCDSRLPSKPQEKFQTQWQGWNHYLSKQQRSPELPFNALKQLVQKQKFCSINEYLIKRHLIADDLPLLPGQIYAEWRGWQDFLGESYQQQVW
jgi:hypothetical protein